MATSVVATKPCMYKPAFTKCGYQKKKGCAIYDERPQPCRDYKCIWLCGWGLRKHRPDRLGLIFEVDETAIVATECRPSALRSKEGVELLKRAREERALALIYFPTKKGHSYEFVGSPEEQEAFIKKNERVIEERAELEEQVCKQLRDLPG